MSQQKAFAPAPRLTWIELEPDTLKRLEKKNAQIRNQIVQTERGELTKDAAKDAYLGEHTQTVDRQSVSNKKSTIMAKPSAASPSARQKAKDMARTSPLATLGVQIIPQRKQETDPEAERRWAEQGTSPQDYVRGIRESDRTALNTKEYVFYGYFQRIRERLDRAWIPILKDRLGRFYRAGRHLASDMDHTTKVMVYLNNGGEIVKVQVLGESGTRDLDEAAVKAFNEAGPFPNPPRGIVDANGQIQIPWEFVLKT